MSELPGAQQGIYWGKGGSVVVKDFYLRSQVSSGGQRRSQAVDSLRPVLSEIARGARFLNSPHSSHTSIWRRVDRRHKWRRRGRNMRNINHMSLPCGSPPCTATLCSRGRRVDVVHGRKEKALGIVIIIIVMFLLF